MFLVSLKLKAQGLKLYLSIMVICFINLWVLTFLPNP